MLEIRGLSAGYGENAVLFDLSMDVCEGSLTVLVGANAAGKTTTCRAISGEIPARAGTIHFEGKPIEREPSNRRVERGLVQVPEGRRLFPFMTVEENLLLGSYAKRARAARRDALSEVFELLPRVAERRRQLAGSLSGGEQSMVAIGRGLMARPRLLVMDEPTLGLAPIFVERTFEIIGEIRRRGVTVLLVEQNVKRSLSLSDRAYVLEHGQIVMQGAGAELLTDEGLRRAYLGM
ncbi:MAG TPA: ABC transporter ATP-binding protein [Candidatus Dormibacteraeota bacterium]|nr:ABC transporter ATP-binding protein [Candidatus Dormibacteraeota bacterium]